VEEKERAEEQRRPPASTGNDVMTDAFQPQEVTAMLNKASRSTSPGTDLVHNELMIHGGEKAAATLLALYNLIWSTGCSPKKWQEALIRPIYKAASKEPLMVENWRAVTLVNVLAKGYESILCLRITNHLEQRRNIAPGQGARRNVGTEELVYTLISAARDRHAHNGSGTYAAFIDFRLAYPSTDHSVIFEKMHNKGITGRLWLAVRQLYQSPKSRVMHPAMVRDLTTWTSRRFDASTVRGIVPLVWAERGKAHVSKNKSSCILLCHIVCMLKLPINPVVNFSGPPHPSL
jgi:hypothetical protein